MGFKEAALPMTLFVVGVCGIAQSAITVKTYLETNKAKDSSFKFSLAILIISVFLVFGGGFFAYKAFTAAPEASPENAAAAEAARILGGLEIPTTEEISKAVPNVKAFTNVPALRAAEQNFKTAVEKTKAELNAVAQSVDNRVANKAKALQQAAEVLAVAQSKGN